MNITPKLYAKSFKNIILFILIFGISVISFATVLKFLFAEFGNIEVTVGSFSTPSSLFVLAFSQTAGTILAYFISKKYVFDTKDRFIFKKKELKENSKYIITATFLMVIVTILFDLIVRFSGISEPNHSTARLFTSENISTLRLTILISFVVIVAPITEELIFRGIFQEYIKQSTSTITSIIITSLAFSSLHFGVSTGGLFSNLLYVGIAFSLSIILCHYKEKSGYISTTIIIHAIFNGIQILGLFLLT